jgi:hypothetical protein
MTLIHNESRYSRAYKNVRNELIVSSDAIMNVNPPRNSQNRIHKELSVDRVASGAQIWLWATFNHVQGVVGNFLLQKVGL